MPSITDYLDRMTVTETSPDGQIFSTVTNYTEVRISFRPGSYDRYDEGELSYQLGRLGGKTWVAYHRERSEAYRLSQGFSRDELAAAERPSDDPHQRRYEEELNRIQGEGRSTGGAIAIHTVGMTQWLVEIAPGAVSQLGEEAFLAELHSAIRSLLEDRQRKIIVLKSDYFDIGIPRRWRELMTELRAINRRTS